MTKTIRASISVYLPIDIIRQLESAAEVRNITRNKLAEELIINNLNNIKSDPI